jgi:hypothetical protein
MAMYWYIMHSSNGHGKLQMHLSFLQQVTTLFLFLIHVATVLAIPVVNFAQHNLFLMFSGNWTPHRHPSLFWE